MRYGILTLLLLSLLSCGHVNEYQPMVFPAETWQKKAPEELGVDAKKLKEALAYWASESGEVGLEEIFIARKGFVIYKGDSIYKKHDSHSSGQTFTSAVMGILTDFYVIDEMTLARKIDTAMAQLYSGVRMKHFATMTSGYTGKEASPWGGPSEDPQVSPYVLGQPLFAPGTQYAYSHEAQMMFARILTMKGGKTLKEIFDEHIGQAIGLGEYQWATAGEVNGIPINKGYDGVMVNAEQLARFGHFFLNEGHWNGKQVVSRYWILEATNNQVFAEKVAGTHRNDIDGRGCYGYHWWVNATLPSGNFLMPDAPKSLYYTGGLNNVVCFVIPEWEMVIVRGGEDGGLVKNRHVVYNEFFKQMGEAVTVKQ